MKKKNRKKETEGNKLSKNFTTKNKKQEKIFERGGKTRTGGAKRSISEFLFPSELLLLLVTKVNKKLWIASFVAMTETIETEGFPLRGVSRGAIQNDKKIKNMGKLEPLNLAIRARNPDYYDKSRDMETALAYNAIKKVLESEGREELFGYIKSVKLTDKNIVITTMKPIANAELKNYKEKLLKEVNVGLKGISATHREGLKLN